MVNRNTLLAALLCWLTIAVAAKADDENDYYRLVSVDVAETSTSSRAKNWKPAPDGLALEVSGLAVLDDRRVAVAIRKGEISILDGVYD